MQFFLFGPSSRGLFGTLHETTSAPAPVAVLLCAPWGQEGVRTHRMLRVLGDRLSRAGVPALRFDYHGSGDAPGDDLAVTLEGCAADVLEAHRELVTRTGARRVVWLGVRLGATVALQALRSGTAMPGPDQVLAWEPVIDGAAYLAQLRLRHVEALENSYTIADPAWRECLASDPAAFDGEAMGFALSEPLRQELADLTPASFAGLRVPRLTAIAPADADTPALLEAACGTGVAHFERRALDHEFDWASEEAMNTALVPGPVIQTLYELCIPS